MLAVLQYRLQVRKNAQFTFFHKYFYLNRPLLLTSPTDRGSCSSSVAFPKDLCCHGDSFERAQPCKVAKTSLV